MKRKRQDYRLGSAGQAFGQQSESIVAYIATSGAACMDQQDNRLVVHSEVKKERGGGGVHGHRKFEKFGRCRLLS